MSTMPESIGLTGAEARRRLDRDGPNSLPEQAAESAWQRWLRQFRNPLIYILIFALVCDLLAWWFEGLDGAPVQSITIAVILLFNATLGSWQESRSEAALRRLRELSAPQCWVYRDGDLARRPSAELVVGDRVRVESGERIAADGRLDRAAALCVDESILTGESVPIEKSDADDVLFGTLAVRGNGFFSVTATGRASSMGQLATLLGSIARERSPLERRLDTFGTRVAWIVIGLAAAVLAFGLATRGLDDFPTLFLFAVALAVAAVPESLPAVLTLALALGVERMAAKNAVVRRLSAVEALGSVTVIATDKTGTLTENEMRVDRLDSDQPAETLRAMVLANDADPDSGAGDPLESGLLRFAAAQSVDATDLRARHPRISNRPFDADWKCMRATVETDAGPVSYLKGAPEIVLARCDLSPAQVLAWIGKIDAYAAEGFRTLAFAMRPGAADEGLEWLGIALLWDPPRREVPDAIAKAIGAGIRVVMMTGDHPATAKSIAQQVGIPCDGVVTGGQLEALDAAARERQIMAASVFARVTPAHKLEIVNVLRRHDETVAVTGDGVNDAPALKAADVGIAMGIRGSDVSREVADLVLLDDNFATLVAAIEEGRSIYENIQKFVRTLLSANLSEVVLLAVGALLMFASADAGAELWLPLAAVQILWMNLVTDSLPALALATDRNPRAMERRPRPASAPLLDRDSIRFVVVAATLGGLVGLGLLWQLPRSGVATASTQTIVFCFLVFVQLSYVLPARRVHWRTQFNWLVLLAIAASAAAQFSVLLLPGLSVALQTVPLGWTELGTIALATLACWAVAEATSWQLRRSAADAAVEVSSPSPAR